MPIKGLKSTELTDRVVSIVMAGGQGTRLFPLTQSRCKPAVFFGGHYRLIDIPLSNSINSGIFRIFVISQFFSSELHQHIGSAYHLDTFRKGQIEMLCPEERPEGKVWFQGTADAVRQNLKHILKLSADYFLILSGDQLYNINFQEMVAFAVKHKAEVVVAALPVKEAEARRMGLLKVDAQNKIIDFVEKPQDPAVLTQLQLSSTFLKEGKFPKSDAPHYLGSMGIYVFTRQALIDALAGNDQDFGKHVIPKEIKKGKSAAFIYDGYWEDIGTISSYYEANLALASRKSCMDMYDERNPIFTLRHQLPSPLIKDTLVTNSLISQGAIVEAKEIHNSIVGVRSRIKRGTIIRDSVIMGHRSYAVPEPQTPPLPDHFSIGENCLIERAIIDEYTQLGDNVQLINKNKLQNFDGSGIYVRDGIIIVTKGTQLPDGFVF
jgi:glucose-1-phosphate adenylyltransferase